MYVAPGLLFVAGLVLGVFGTLLTIVGIAVYTDKVSRGE